MKESGEPFKEFEFIESFDFYENTKKAFRIIAASESAQYVKIILKKGVVR